MSSSTMIHGVTMRRASAYRIPNEITTSPATQAHIGTRRRNAIVLLTETDLAQPRREDARVVDPHFGRRRRDVAQHALGDRGAAREPLEGRGIGLGDAVDAVLALDQLPRALAHRGADGRVGER